MDAWHLRGTPELSARDACLTAVTSFGRLTDTLTKCLTQGSTSTSLHRSPPLTAADPHVWSPDVAAAPADILLTFEARETSEAASG
jgi:hypothetical protein